MRRYRWFVASVLLSQLVACTSFFPTAPYTQAIGIGVSISSLRVPPRILINGCSTDMNVNVQVGNGADPDQNTIAEIRINNPAFPVTIVAANGVRGAQWSGNITELNENNFWVKAVTESNGQAVGLFEELPSDDKIYAGFQDDQTLGRVRAISKNALKDAYNCET